MTKLKNTKKGMAKKALSISLVAAMLATSNVPVWAAEDLFSDGSAAVEAPVVEEPVAEVDTFSAEPVEETAPAVETQATEVGTGYTVTTTGFKVGGNAITNNEVVWGNTVQTSVTVTETKDAPSNTTLHAVWKDKDGAFGQTVPLTEDVAKELSVAPTAAQSNTNLQLYIYAQQNGQVVWSWTSDSITVKPKDIDNVLTAGTNIKIKDDFKKTYTGKNIIPTIDDIDFSGLPTSGEFSQKDFVIGSTEGDTVNVTDKGVDVYLSVNKTGYTGSIVLNYEITPLTINSTNASEWLEASFVKTSTAYTGNTIYLKSADVKVVDKKSGVDLSSYIKSVSNDQIIMISGDKYIKAGTQFNTGKDGDADLTFAIATPTESTYKNYEISGEVTLKPTNSFTITKRDLSTVNVSIPEKAYDNGNIVTVAPSEATYWDKDTNEELTLEKDVIITSTASTQGVHTVTVSPATNNTNVQGSTTAQLSIAASSLATAEFSNMTYAKGAEEYTGERILKDISKLGTVSISDSSATGGKRNLVNGEDYTVEFGTNINAGDDKGVIIIRGLKSYVGSTKTITFDINPAEVTKDTVSVNKYVEIIDTQKASDYKASMGLVVKAKNKDGKEFTLTEGTDYVIDKFEFIDKDTNGTTSEYEVGDKVRVTLKTTNGNLKNTNFKATTTTFESTITNKILKSENIKLKKTSYTYTGAAIEPDFDVVVDGRVIPPSEYKIKSLTNNVNAGTATMVITGAERSSYSTNVDASITFNITSADASKLSGAMPSVVYTGYSIQPAKDNIHVTLDNVSISVKDNFDVSYGENIKIGEGTIILTPKNANFTGTKTITFKITGQMLSDGDLKYYDANGLSVVPNYTYDGTAHSAAKTVFDFTTTKIDKGNGKVTLDENLTEGVDYEIQYVDNIYGKKDNTSQKGIVLVIAKGNYAANYTGNGVTDGIYTNANGDKIENVIYAEQFIIEQEEISVSNVSVSNGTYAGGLPVKPNVTINVKGKTLVEGTDYDLKLDLTGNDDLVNTTLSKSLNVQIIPKNGYKADKELANKKFSWGIDKFNLSSADITVDGDKVTVKCGRVDVPTSEYTISKDAEADTVTITAVKDSKNYTGSKTVSANVEDPTEKPDAPVIQSVNVNGNNATVVLAGESDGATGYDYVISKDRDCITSKDYDKVNKNVLTTDTTFTYTQQGVYYAYCHAWKRVDGEKVFSDWSAAYPFVVSSITPEQPSITKVEKSSNGKHLRITWTKSANATGYDVVMGTKLQKVNGEYRPVEYGKAVKKVTNGNTVSVIFYNIPKGTYYVGLHAYNRSSESGVKVFSQWSNSKKVTF